MISRTCFRLWLAGLCLILSSSLQAQKQDWQLTSFGILLQYQLPAEPEADRPFIEAHLFEDSFQEEIPEGAVRRTALPAQGRFRSGLNLTLERQLAANRSAQLRLNVNYSPNAQRSLLMPDNAITYLSQEGLGFRIDYRRTLKRGIFTFSAGIGAGGKWFINPSMQFLTRLDSAETAALIGRTGVGTLNNPNMDVVALAINGVGPIRSRLEYNLHLPLGVAIRLTRRFQLEFDARLAAGAQQIVGKGFYRKPIGGSFQLAYVFLL